MLIEHCWIIQQYSLHFRRKILLLNTYTHEFTDLLFKLSFRMTHVLLKATVSLKVIQIQTIGVGNVFRLKVNISGRNDVVSY